jgi:hypothetical protein
MRCSKFVHTLQSGRKLSRHSNITSSVQVWNCRCLLKRMKRRTNLYVNLPLPCLYLGWFCQELLAITSATKKHLVAEGLACRGSIGRVLLYVASATNFLRVAEGNMAQGLECMHAKENKIDDISHMQR